MSLVAFILIFLSASSHAAWNILAKKSHMGLAYYAVMCSFSALLWSHNHLWRPFPIASLPGEFWWMLAGSIASDSILYCCGLCICYRRMEISTVYPMMRSLPLLFTAGITWAVGWGKPLNAVALAGMAVVFCGCLLMPLKSFGELKISNYLNWGMLAVIMVALGTTGYTIFDNQAMQVMSATHPEIGKGVLSLSYYSIRGVALSTALWSMTLLNPHSRQAVWEIFQRREWSALLAGGCASFTYVLVLIAMLNVTNVSYVQAFRQMGLLLGMAGGVVLFGERITRPKIVGICFILGGLILTVLPPEMLAQTWESF